MSINLKTIDVVPSRKVHYVVAYALFVNDIALFNPVSAFLLHGTGVLWVAKLDLRFVAMCSRYIRRYLNRDILALYNTSPSCTEKQPEGSSSAQS